jgi:aminoglycoside phosphotransferase (APT) family kinase protein
MWIVGHYGARYGVYITKSNIVKFAPAIQTSREIIAIEFVRQNCPNIPVPEVYGAWEVDEDDGGKTGYFAMSVLPGSILRDPWPTMTDGEKKTVLDDFAAVLAQL